MAEEAEAPEVVEPVVEPAPEAVEFQGEAEAKAEAPVVVPPAIVDQPSRETRASAESRVDVFLAETRYFLSTLDHEFDGEAGEILAFLREKLKA